MRITIAGRLRCQLCRDARTCSGVWCIGCRSFETSQGVHSCAHPDVNQDAIAAYGSCELWGGEVTKFRVWEPKEGGTFDDARTVRAYDAKDAAEEWAKREDWNSAEYYIVSGKHEPTVCVVPADESDPARQFVVTGESHPVYHATEVKP
jgi:hypothetical protein